MSDLYVDGNLKVSFVPAIANIHAPTTTELNAGTGLETYITPTGLQIKATTASVDTSNLASTFTTQGVGRRSFAITVEMKRQSPTDTAYNLVPYRTSGYLVVRRNLTSATAWASGQNVEVYPVVTGERELAPPVINEVQKFVSSMMVTTDPDTAAVIA
ncbi:MAG: hypothetical protein HOW97_17150 [Catenulispora sp.]|nr:hypothetical protein [Catenulispora sp.]